MTREKKRRVKFLPSGVADVDTILRRHIAMRLRLIEEVACGSQVSWTDALDQEEAREGLLRSFGRDWKADEKAIVEYHIAEVWEWWQAFPERELLTDLLRRAARANAKCGSLDSRRRPSHEEGLRVARALVVDIAHAGKMDFEGELATVTKMLADLLLPPLGVCSRGRLRPYIRCSRSSRVHFDALERICEVKDSSGEGIPRPLLRWRLEVVSGCRRRPPRRRRPFHRPVNPAKVLRDFQIQFTIEVLRRVGIPPRGSVSGCLIASEALGCEEFPEETVVGIWKNRKIPFALEMRRHWKAIAERAGLSQYQTKA